MASADFNFLAEIDRVDSRSKEKHEGEDWRDMTFLYCFMKMLGHLLKWWWTGRGYYNGRSGPHHLAKVAWYCDKVMWSERFRKENDNRPYKGQGQMAETFVVNVVKTVFGKMK